MVVRNPVVMGILNLSPESFYDGGKLRTPGDAVEHAKRMIAEGAEIIDIGGESTRPGCSPVSAEIEWQRMGDVLEEVAKLGVKVSVDTYKLSVAELALGRGASIVNDVCAFEHLGEVIDLAKRYDAELIVMHNARNCPPPKDIVADIAANFERAVATAKERGFEAKNLILDVGIGFGTTPAQDLEIIARLGELTGKFSERILIGASRKSFMGSLGELVPNDRLPCTLAATMSAYLSGCAMFRVHDVRENCDVLNFAKSVYGR